MTRFLCIWFPNWPIQRLGRCQPELKSGPAALVIHGLRGGTIAACSNSAAAQGVSTGMPLAEAQSLAPRLNAVPYDPLADRRALEKLAETCEQFTPFVALEEVNEPQSLLLDITNLEHLHGSEHELVQRVKNHFTRRGYRVRLAVAETIGQAWALAQYECSNDETRMTNEQPHSSFTNLPIQALRIPTETTAVLHELGIETVAQLQSLPREDLAQRFGDELLWRLDQFDGTASEAPEPHRALAELEATYMLEEPSTDRFMLLGVLDSLVQKLCRSLAARDQGAVLLLCTLQRAGSLGMRRGEASSPAIKDCKMQLASSGSHLSTLNSHLPPAPSPQPPAPSLRIGLMEPSANPQQLMELIELHMETLKLADEVDHVQIRVAAAGRLSERQGELFTDRWPSNPHQLSVLINRLSSRLGHNHVLRAEPRSSPIPERAVRWRPITGTSRSTHREPRSQRLRRATRRPQLKETQSAFRIPHSTFPLFLYPHPQPIEVVCVSPDGPPQCIWLDNSREQIIHQVGPERIETLWWRGPTIHRDYYRITTEEGIHLWIFRRLTDRRWFLHGHFT